MIVRPSPKHIDVVELEAYAARLVDLPTETDVEQHLLECAVCRAALATVVAEGKISEITPDRLGTIWIAVAARIDEPPSPAMAHPVRRIVRWLWERLRHIQSFTIPSARPLPWLRWVAVPIAVLATAVVIMNVEGTAPYSADPLVAAAGGNGSAVPSGGEDSRRATVPLMAVPGQSAVVSEVDGAVAPAVIVPGAASVDRTAGSGPLILDGEQFPPGVYVAAFLPTIPDGNKVVVTNGRLTIPAAGGVVAEPDAFAGAEATWRHAVDTGLVVAILAVGGGNYVVVSGPYNTAQDAQAACDRSALDGAHCVAAQPQSSIGLSRSGLPKAV